jgi:hypothetical protein
MSPHNFSTNFIEPKLGKIEHVPTNLTEDKIRHTQLNSANLGLVEHWPYLTNNI